MKQFLKDLADDLRSDAGVFKGGILLGSVFAAAFEGISAFSILVAGSAGGLPLGLLCLAGSVLTAGYAVHIAKWRPAPPPPPQRGRTVSYTLKDPLRAGRRQPLGPKFHAVALTAEEASLHLVRNATVLLQDINVNRPLQLKI